MMLATEKYAVADPVNLGSDEEVSMEDLVETIIRLSGKAPALRLIQPSPMEARVEIVITQKQKRKWALQQSHHWKLVYKKPLSGTWRSNSKYL